MSEANMKPENQPIPSQKPDMSDDQKKDEATRNFLHPENKPPRLPEKSWLRRNLGIIIVVIAIVIGGAGFGIYQDIKSHEPVSVPSTFDVSALNSVIGANDSVQMTWDEYTATAPPIWNGQNEVMTVPVPLLFKDNRAPTLSIKKIESQFDGRLNRISIDGLEPGDTVLSLIDGEIEINQGHENDLAVFTLYTQDSEGHDIDIMYLTSGLEIDPSIVFDKPINDHILIPIKKNQPIGKMVTSDKLELIGNGPLLQSFNLAVTPENKAIILK
jgi:hypothetical protein